MEAAVVLGALKFTHAQPRSLFCDGLQIPAHDGAERIEQTKALAAQASLPVADIECIQDTFQLLALARQYLFGAEDEQTIEQLRTAKKAYKAKYPKTGPRYRYRVKLDFTPLMLQPRYLHWGMDVVSR